MSQLRRHDRILKHLAEHGILDVDEAVRLTGASPASVRRDFAQLAEQGVLQRVRGGVRLERTNAMPPFAVREVQSSAEKAAIAHRAVQLLRPGDSLFIDGGTTTFHLGAVLPHIPLRVITNSVRLGAYLDEHAPNRLVVEVFLTGGFLHPHSGLLLGPGAQASLAQYHVDWAFLSVGGITEAGLFNNNEMVVESERLMIANARKVVVVADHIKIGRHALCNVCPLEQVDHLITDDHPTTRQTLSSLRSLGLDIISVPLDQ